MEQLIKKKADAMANAPAQQSMASIINTMLDGNKMRKRFEELLGERSAQFISSLVTLVNADKGLQQAMFEAPMTVIQSGLKAASFDLPIEPSLGFSHIVAFKNGKTGKMEATFIPGYRGLIQLCLRTGAYERIPDAVDVREGELVKYDRLTGDCEFNWVDDEDERDQLPIIGYAGFFRLKNGAEKTLYMTKKQIEAHERKNRKGQYMGKVWRDDFDSMAKKTVIRRLISHYGLMSIQYQSGNNATVSVAQAVMEDEAAETILVDNYETVDGATGEVIEEAQA